MQRARWRSCCGRNRGCWWPRTNRPRRPFPGWLPEKTRIRLAGGSCGRGDPLVSWCGPAPPPWTIRWPEGCCWFWTPSETAETRTMPRLEVRLCIPVSPARLQGQSCSSAAPESPEIEDHLLKKYKFFIDIILRPSVHQWLISNILQIRANITHGKLQKLIRKQIAIIEADKSTLAAMTKFQNKDQDHSYVHLCNLIWFLTAISEYWSLWSLRQLQLRWCW